MSRPPFDSLDLALHVGDDPDAVAVNRSRLAAALGLGVDGWWFLDQVHGDVVVTVTGPATGAPPSADAAVTAERCVPLVVLTADCAPVLIASDDAVGVVHAGWRGLEAGVCERAVERLTAIGSGEVRAVIGPCIRPDAYEFGADDLARLAERFGGDVAARTAAGAPALDLAAGVRSALRAAGVVDVEDLGVCTASDPRFFSHRRDGRSGRQALVAWIP